MKMIMKRILIVSLALAVLVVLPTSAAQAQDSWTGGHVVMGANAPSTTWYFAEGYTGPGFEEWICIQNPQSDLVPGTITYMLGDGSRREQALSLPANSRTTVMVNSFIGGDQNVSAKVEAEQPVIAERPMYFNYKGVWNGGHNVMGVTAPSTDWYFAEGTTREGFDTWLCLMNPGNSIASVKVIYMFPDGTTQAQDTSIGATTRKTIMVNDIVGPHRDVSMRVTTDQPIIAERPMYFNYQDVWTGGSDAIGASKPDKTWYFAEGTTQSNFDQYVTVQNPGDNPAGLTFNYMVEGQGLQTVSGSVLPHSRGTFNTRSQIGDGKNVSLQITSDQEVVAERPMYFNYHGVWNGGHVVMGANSPNTDWYFAEGATHQGINLFDEWLCIQNPGSTAISVSATYMLGPGQGDPVVKFYQVPAQERLTILVNGEVGTEKDVSVHLSSTANFVAERPMYFDYHPIGSGSIYWPGRDKTPPQTNEVLLPPVAGWTNQSVQVTLEAHDYESGVQRTYYSTDGEIFNIYSGPFTLSTSGIYPLEYYSTDNVGNIESVKTGSVIRIDKIQPTIDGLATDGITANTVRLVWSGHDNSGGSGIAYYRIFRNGSFIAQVSGNEYMAGDLVPRTGYGFVVSAVDNAGNESPQATVASATVDLPAPLNLQLVAQPYLIEASWQQPSPEVVAYHLYLSTDGINWVDRGVVVSSTDATLSGLVPNTSYFVRVLSRDINGYDSLVYAQDNIRTPPDI